VSPFLLTFIQTPTQRVIKFIRSGFCSRKIMGGKFFVADPYRAKQRLSELLLMKFRYEYHNSLNTLAWQKPWLTFIYEQSRV